MFSRDRMSINDEDRRGGVPVPIATEEFTFTKGVRCVPKQVTQKEGRIHLDVHLLTPWHYSPDGHKPPLIRFHSLMFSVFEEQVANLLPQHRFESA
jgi:hypothetical protein